MTRPVTLRDQRYDAIKGVIAVALNDQDFDRAAPWAQKRWGMDGWPTHLSKASGVTGVSDAGSQIMIDTAMFRTIRERAVLFRMTGTRRVSFRTRSLLASGATANWLGEGAPMPFSKVTFDPSGLPAYKLGAGAVATKEALQLGAEVERTLFDELVRAITDELDATFLNPANAGTGDVVPAAITNGVTPVTATGSTGDEIRADLTTLINGFGGNLRSAYWVMHPTVAAARLGLQDFIDDLGIRGGELMGAPVLTSETAPKTSIALIDPTGIQVAHDDDILLTASEAGTVEIGDTPAQDAMDGTGAQMLSLFQNNLVGFKGRLAASWKRAQDGAVGIIQTGGADWLAA